MTEFDFDALLTQAQEATQLGEGVYHTQIRQIKVTKSSNGNPRLAICHEVVEGPKTGAQVWDGIVLSPGNPKSVLMFARRVGAYGVSSEVIRSCRTVDEVADHIDRSRSYYIRLKHRVVGDRTFEDVEITDGAGGGTSFDFGAPAKPVDSAPSTAAAPSTEEPQLPF